MGNTCAKGQRKPELKEDSGSAKVLMNQVDNGFTELLLMLQYLKKHSFLFMIDAPNADRMEFRADPGIGVQSRSPKLSKLSQCILHESTFYHLLYYKSFQKQKMLTKW